MKPAIVSLGLGLALTGCPTPYVEKDTGPDGCETVTWYRDADSDGYGADGNTVEDCVDSQPAGYVADAGDCNDGSPSVGPAAREACNNVDDDCDGTIDEDAEDAPFWYRDADTDGYGDSADVERSCDEPPGYTHVDGDCDDTDPALHPDAKEICDAIDNDCDSQVDEGLTTQTWYADVDGDGYGQPKTAVDSCASLDDHALHDQDCDDGDATVNPGEEDQCDDGVDQDCSGTDATCFRALLSEWETSNVHLWDPQTGDLTLHHEARANDADCNEDEGSTLGFLAEHYDDQLWTYVPGTLTGATVLADTTYAYPKHLAMYGGELIVMSRNDTIVYRYSPSTGVVLGSFVTSGVAGQGVATDGSTLFVSVWDGASASILEYDASFVLLAQHPAPSGLAYGNLVDLAYDSGSGFWLGMDATGEGGTGTHTNQVVSFDMGGSVIGTYTLPFEIDGIGTYRCP